MTPTSRSGPLLTINGTFPSDYDMAQAIAGMWQRIGIQADLQVTTPPKVLSEIQAAKMSGALQTPLADYRALYQEASVNSWAISLLQAVTSMTSRSSLDAPTFDSGYVLSIECMRK